MIFECYNSGLRPCISKTLTLSQAETQKNHALSPAHTAHD
jgi:hypothetical protein